MQYLGEISGTSGTTAFGPQTQSTLLLGPLPAGESYAWRVKARGAGGDGPWSTSRTFSLRLNTPANLEAEATSCTTATLAWDDTSSNEAGFRIFRDGAAIGDVAANATSASLANLTGDTTSVYQVRAFRGAAESAASNAMSITTPACDVTPPSASWVQPSAGATIRSASVRLEVAANDGQSGVDRVDVQARWDGVWRDLQTLRDAPYVIDWNVCTAGVSDGALTLRARVFDRSGNLTATTVDATKRVDCGPLSPPAAPQFATPLAGSAVWDDVPVAVIASDAYDRGDELVVEFKIDNGPWIATTYDSQSGRYLGTWDSASVADGGHTLIARSTDSGGLTTASAPIQVTADNTSQPLVANAGADFTVTDGDGNGSEPVSLDGRASSYDPQRSAQFSWQDRWDGRAETQLGSGARVEVALGLGVHTVTLTVTDSRGFEDSDDIVVTVTAAPDLSPPTVAWTLPSDGATISSRTVRIGASATDSGGSGVREIRVRARWNGSWRDIASFENPSNTVAFDWDMCAAGAPDGTIDLELGATDGAGNQAASTPTRAIAKRFGCGPTPSAALAVSAASGAPGQSIVATVSGFASGETVTLNWQTDEAPDSRTKKKKHKGKENGKGKNRGKKRNRAQNNTPAIASIAVASSVVSADGRASMTFAIPAQSPSGEYRLSATGSAGSSASVTVSVQSNLTRSAAPPTAEDETDSLTGEPEPPPNDPVPDAAVLPGEAGQQSGANDRRDRPERSSPKRRTKQRRGHAASVKHASARDADNPRRRRHRRKTMPRIASARRRPPNITNIGR